MCISAKEMMTVNKAEHLDRARLTSPYKLNADEKINGLNSNNKAEHLPSI